MSCWQIFALRSFAKLQAETAQGLTIRVINNVSKRMEAKPRFHEAFQKEGCPDAFPYRQKVLNTVLFQSMQKIPCKLHLGGFEGTMIAVRHMLSMANKMVIIGLSRSSANLCHETQKQIGDQCLRFKRLCMLGCSDQDRARASKHVTT